MDDLTGKTVGASLFRQIEAVGGKILFESDKLIFNSHTLNMQTGSTVIEYSQIRDVRKRSTMGLVPNGILIVTKDGMEYKFVVFNRSKIIEFLLSKKQ